MNYPALKIHFNKKTIAKLSSVLLLVSVALTTPRLVSSQTTAPTAPPHAGSITLTAIPPRLGSDGSLVLQPGETKQVQIRVNNPTAQTVKILSTTSDFTLAEDGETPIPITGDISNRWSLASWLALAPGEQVIAPHQTVGLNVLIKVPKDALPGGHYAMITHQPQIKATTKNTALNNNSMAGITQKVGTLLYVIVDGPINEEAFIRKLQAPSLIEYGPVPINFDIENMSDVHISPKISLEFTDWLGRRADKITVPSKNVFPLGRRSFETKWDRIWGLGRYKATLTASYGQSGKVAIAATHFWLIPITLILAILVVILTIVAIIIAIRHHLKHRKDQESKKMADLEAKIKELESRDNKHD